LTFARLLVCGSRNSYADGSTGGKDWYDVSIMWLEATAGFLRFAQGTVEENRLTEYAN